MEVILLTTLFSVLFAILFLLLFLKVRQDPDACADQDALLPFRDDDIDPASLPLSKSSTHPTQTSEKIHERTQ